MLVSRVVVDTMKQLLIVILALGLADCQSEVPEPGYAPGKEYVYHYNTQVMTGLPQGAQAYSGLKVECQPVIQFKSETNVKLQFRNVRIYKVNDNINEGNPTREMLPTDVFTEMTGQEYTLIKQQLVRPITFTWTRGHVTDLTTNSDEPAWSVNIKRGLLSMFEINFNERQSLTPRSGPVNPEQGAHFFSVVEPSAAGECETTYHVTPAMNYEHHNYMNVMKVRDMNRCLDTVVMPYSIMGNLNCPQCPHNQTPGPFTRQSSVRYSILGTPEQFSIVSAIGESQYSFSPFSETGGQMTTFINQTLVMVHSKDIESRISEPQSPKKHAEALKADYPDQRTSLSVPDVESETPEQTRYYQMAKHLLQILATYTADKIQEEAGVTYPEFYFLMRKMNTKYMTRFYREFTQNSASNKNIRKIFLDTLPTIGTYPAIEVMMMAVENNDMTPTEAGYSFMLFSMLPSPDANMVKTVTDYVSGMKSWPSVEMKRSVYLCLGSLANKMLMTNHTEYKRMEGQLSLVTRLQEQANQAFVRRKLGKQRRDIDRKMREHEELYSTTRETIIEIVRNLLHSEELADRVLAVKSIANAGFEEFYPDCQQLLLDTNIPFMIRVETFNALRKMYTIHAKIQDLLLPIFFNYQEKDVYRMMSFYILMNFKTPYPVVEMIAKTLYDEPSYNVGAFVWEYLTESSNRTWLRFCPCVQTLAQNATLALRFAPRYDQGMQQIKYKYSAAYSEQLNMGHSWETMMMHSPEHFFPQVMKIHYNAELFQQNFPVFQAGYCVSGDWGEGAEKNIPDILANLLKPRTQRSAQENEDEIESIKRKLNVPETEGSLPQGHVYVRLFDQEITYFGFNGENINAPAPVDLQRMFNMFRSIMLPVLYSNLPSDMGLPIMMSTDVMSVFKLNTEINFKSSEKPEEAAPANIWNINVNLQKNMMFQWSGFMQLEFPFLRSGAFFQSYFNSDVPVNFDLKIDYSNNKYIMIFNNAKPIQLYMESRPFTFLSLYPADGAHFTHRFDYKEISFVEGCEVRPIMWQFGEKALGHELSLHGEQVWRTHDGIPFFPFNGKYQLMFHFKPGPIPAEVQWQFVHSDPTIEEMDSDSNQSIVGWVTSWFSAGSTKPSPSSRQPQRDRESSRQARMPEDRQENSANDPNQGFDNLDYVDVTLQTVVDKFRPTTQIFPDGPKYGFVFRVAETGKTPLRQMQFSYMWQCNPSGFHHLHNFILRRSPIPGEENTPWQMETQIDTTFPSRQIKPSDLENEEYQRSVKLRIRSAIKEDIERLDSVVSLPSLMYKLAVKKMQKLRQKANIKQMIDSVMDHVIDRTTEESNIDLARTAMKLRAISQKIKSIQDLVSNPLKALKSWPQLQSEIEKIESEQEKVSQLIDMHENVESSPKAALVYYCLIQQKSAIKRLEKIAEKMEMVAPTLQANLVQKIEEVSRRMEMQKQKQNEKIVSSTSRQYVQDPQIRSLHQLLREAVEKILSLSQTVHENIQSSAVSKESLSTIAVDAKTIYDMNENLKSKLDEILLEKTEMRPDTRTKVLELVLLKQLAIKEYYKLIRLVQDKPVIERQQSEAAIMEGVELKQKLTEQVKKLLNRLCMAISLEQEDMSDVTPQQDQQDYESLKQAEIKQMKALELVSWKQFADARKEPSQIQTELKKAVDSADEIQRSLKEIAERLQEKDIREKKYAGPVFIKLLLVAYQQAELIEQIKSSIIKSPTVSSEKMQMKASLEEKKLECLKIGKAVSDMWKTSMKSQALREQEEPLEPFEESRESRESEVEKPLPDSAMSIMTIQKAIHGIQSQQLEQESLIRQIKSRVRSSARDSGEVSQKTDEIIQKAQDIQQKVSYLMQQVDKVLRRRPNDLSIQKAIIDLKKCIDQQSKSLHSTEAVMLDVSRDKLSQVQKARKLEQVQELRDQCLQYSVSLRNIVERQSPPTSYSSRPRKLRSDTSPDCFHMLVTVMHGLDKQEPNKIYMKVFGKKSLSQLLWEVRQQSPLSEEPLLRKYRNEREEKDDKFAPSYKKLATQLNTYNHIHFMCAYHEEFVPVPVREFLWKLHESMKFMYYDRAYFHMPNELNVRNNFEVITEFRPDVWVDMLVRTPYETTMFEAIHVPWYMQYFNVPYVNSQSLEMRAKRKFPVSRLVSRCEITSRRIKSLDGLVTDIPTLNEPCSSVLAMDCSKKSSFAVISSPLQPGQDKKTIKILTKQHKVEIIPDQNPPRVLVNDQIINIRRGKIEEIEIDQKICRIQRKDNFIMVTIPSAYITVQTDGIQVDIEVPQSVHKSRMCGLCGNLDGEISNDLQGPMKVKFPEEKSFMSTYLIPDNQCDAESIQAERKVPEIRQRSAERKPIWEISKVEKMVMGQPMLCLSKEKVKKCLVDFMHSEPSSRQVAYHCVNKNRRQAERYLEMSEKNLLAELELRSTSDHYYVHEPRICIAA